MLQVVSRMEQDRQREPGYHTISFPQVGIVSTTCPDYSNTHVLLRHDRPQLISIFRFIKFVRNKYLYIIPIKPSYSIFLYIFWLYYKTIYTTIKTILHKIETILTLLQSN